MLNGLGSLSAAVNGSNLKSITPQNENTPSEQQGDVALVGTVTLSAEALALSASDAQIGSGPKEPPAADAQIGSGPKEPPAAYGQIGSGPKEPPTS
ncbi:hypothetical protein ORI99_00690 [Alishewanella sp. SMS9]|nr:hypothetical protein [Alishewanella sp. SMS9]